MPKFSTGKTRITTKQAQDRARTYKVSRNNTFLDTFPLGFGTLPEKIVYEALSRRGIPFLYLNDVELIVPEIEFDQFFQADFIIPSLRIIIEVQGAHWHSMPKTIDADALKFALYQQTGWSPRAWWDFDIIADINKLFRDDPVLSKYGYVGDASTEMPVQRRTKTDTSKGIRTLNKKRAARLVYKKKVVTIKSAKKKVYGSYATGR